MSMIVGPLGKGDQLQQQEELMADYKVGYFVGSLATKSINRLLAKAS